VQKALNLQTSEKNGGKVFFEVHIVGTRSDAKNGIEGSLDKHFAKVLDAVQTLADRGVIKDAEKSPYAELLKEASQVRHTAADKSQAGASQAPAASDKPSWFNAEQDTPKGIEIALERSFVDVRATFAGKAERYQEMLTELRHARDAKSEVDLLHKKGGEAPEKGAEKTPREGPGAELTSFGRALVDNSRAALEPIPGVTTEQDTQASAAAALDSLKKLKTSLSTESGLKNEPELRAELLANLAAIHAMAKTGEFGEAAKANAVSDTKLKTLAASELSVGPENGERLARKVWALGADGPLTPEQVDATLKALDIEHLKLDGPDDERHPQATEFAPETTPESANQEGHQDGPQANAQAGSHGLSQENAATPGGSPKDLPQEPLDDSRANAPEQAPEKVAHTLDEPSAAAGESTQNVPVAGTTGGAENSPGEGARVDPDNVFPRERDGVYLADATSGYITRPQVSLEDAIEGTRQAFPPGEFQSAKGGALVRAIAQAGDPEKGTLDAEKLPRVFALLEELSDKHAYVLSPDSGVNPPDAVEILHRQLEAAESGALGAALKARAEGARPQVDGWRDECGTLHPELDQAGPPESRMEPPKTAPKSTAKDQEARAEHSAKVSASAPEHDAPQAPPGPSREALAQVAAEHAFMEFRNLFERPKMAFLTDEKSWNAEHLQRAVQAGERIDPKQLAQLPERAQAAAAVYLQWLAEEAGRGLLPGVSKEQAEAIAGKARSLSEKLPADVKLDRGDMKNVQTLKGMSQAMRDLGRSGFHSAQGPSAERAGMIARKMTNNERRAARDLMRAGASTVYNNGVNAKDAKLLVTRAAELNVEGARAVDADTNAKALVGLRELLAEVRSGKFGPSVRIADSVLTRAENNLARLDTLVREQDPGNAKTVNAQASFDARHRGAASHTQATPGVAHHKEDRLDHTEGNNVAPKPQAATRAQHHDSGGMER
jgi:hypothetical protein